MISISEAATALKSGALVAFPTETVYGLGADATNRAAVARIYEVKGRPSKHPLIVHLASVDALQIWASRIPEYAHQLALTFWPGPMTLVLPRTDLAGDFVTGGQETVALRIPDHPTALELLQSFQSLGGLGVAAPSANRFGRVSPTSSAHVRSELAPHLGQNDVILEGSAPRVGIESTIIDCTGRAPSILRPGFITEEMVSEFTGLAPTKNPHAPRVSGSMKSHYAPAATVDLNQVPLAGDGLIALAEVETPAGVIRLGAPKSLSEYASSLYAALRNADELGISRVVAITPEGSGLALAIRDRLEKASYR